MKRRQALGLLTAAMGSCGYHVGGKGDTLPTTLKVIAIPPFSNITPRYKLADRMAAAIGREFITRTRFQVVADPANADAVLTGAMLNFVAYPIVADSITGRAAGVQIQVNMRLNLTDRVTGKVLLDRPNVDFRERYEISIDQAQYFDESDAAVERLSRDVARTVVSTLLSAF